MRLGAAALLVVPACGGGSAGPDDAGKPADSGGDGASDDGGGQDAASCQPTCATGSKTVALTFAKYPQLAQVGGSVVFEASGYSDPSCQQYFIIVVQPTAGTYLAFSASCTHACCTVSYDSKHSEFVCPCHNSKYDLQGHVVAGSVAPDPIQKLAACADACGVTVTLP